MQATSLEGGFAAPPVEAASAFRAALQAMSRPGTLHQVRGAAPPAPMSVAAGVLALTLCDHDTPVWLAPSLATDQIQAWLGFHTGAPMAARDAAMFAFGTWAELTPITGFPVGNAEYPDRSATLIVEVPELGTAHRLTGPGIENEAWLTLPDVATLKANAALFPLGLDFFLTSGDQLAGLPRTTRIG